MSKFPIRKEKHIKYVTEGSGDEVLVLLHGLVGTLSNFDTVIEYFSKYMRVVVPVLPLYSLSLRYTSVVSLQRFVNRFLTKMNFPQVHILGNSLGGHVGILQTCAHPETVKTLTLTGSSGLFESGLGDSYPRRGDYEYIKRQAEMIFYDPAVATEELVDEAYKTVNNRVRTLKTLYMARSAMKHNVANELSKVTCPTLLVWGRNDIVTPNFVAEDFHRLIPNSELQWIEKCGHAPMMEHPMQFNQLLEAFLKKQTRISAD